MNPKYEDFMNPKFLFNVWHDSCLYEDFMNSQALFKVWHGFCPDILTVNT